MAASSSTVSERSTRSSAGRLIFPFFLALTCKLSSRADLDFLSLFFDIDHDRFCSRYHDGVSPLPDTSDFLAMLHTNSPLLLMHRYLDLQTIETAAVLEKLKDTSMNIVDDNDLKQRKGRINY